ncbi:MAG: sensor histidine kinase [Actinomycetes bacterium]
MTAVTRAELRVEGYITLVVAVTAILLVGVALGSPGVVWSGPAVVLGTALALVHAAPLETPGRTNAKRTFASELPLLPILLLPAAEAMAAAVTVLVVGRIATALLSPDERMRSTSGHLHLFNAATDLLLVLSGTAVRVTAEPVLGPLLAAVVGVGLAWSLNHLLIAFGRATATEAPLTASLVDGVRGQASAALLWTVGGVLLVQGPGPNFQAWLGLGVALTVVLASHLSAPAVLERGRTGELARATQRVLAAPTPADIRQETLRAARELLGTSRASLLGGRPDPRDGELAVPLPGTPEWLLVGGRPRALGAFTEPERSLLTSLAATAGAAIATGSSLRRAEDSDAARRGLLETIGHDLRGPLATATLALETLRDDRLAPEHRAAAGEALERAVASATRIVDDVVALHGAVDAGLDGPVEVDDVLTDHVPPLADELMAAVRLTLAAGRAEVLVPAQALRRIVENLVRNAVRHGGRDAPVEVHTEVVDEHVVVAVRDRGPGVPAEVVRRLGSAGNHGTPADADGLGLGLRIAVQLTEQHGGHLGIRDRAGGGTSVEVTFALHPD